MSSLTAPYARSIGNLRPELRPQRPAQCNRERVLWDAHRDGVRRSEKRSEISLVEDPVATEDHLLTGSQSDVGETLGLKAEHDGEFLDVAAGEDFGLALLDSDLLQGLGLPDDLNFEGLEASECGVEGRDRFDQRVETSVIVAFVGYGVDVQAEVLQLVDGELLSEEERQVLAAEMACAHAAGVVLDEDFERGAGHDGREEEDLPDLVVTGVVLPV